MKIEIEIDPKELKEAVVLRLSESFIWRQDAQDMKEKIYNSISWKDVTPHVQEAILKMAVKKIFEKSEP